MVGHASSLTCIVHVDVTLTRTKVKVKGLYVCILRARVQPTLDPYAEAFL